MLFLDGVHPLGNKFVGENRSRLIIDSLRWSGGGHYWLLITGDGDCREAVSPRRVGRPIERT